MSETQQGIVIMKMLILLLMAIYGCTAPSFNDKDLKNPEANKKAARATLEVEDEIPEVIVGYEIPNEIPETPEPLPSNIENFCLGLQNAAAMTQQPIIDEINMFCLNGQASPLMASLLANPYQGEGEFRFRDPGSEDFGVILLDMEDEDNSISHYHVAYAVKLPKAPTVILSMEEKNITTPYDGGNLLINSIFLAPPINEGDAYTAFNVEQNTVVDDNVEFDDTSTYDLKMYKLHPNNVDMFLSARTLTTPSEQFKSAKVLRGSFADPQDPNSTYSVGILKFEMNSRDRHERLIDAFSLFVVSDLLTLYDLVAQEVE